MRTQAILLLSDPIGNVSYFAPIIFKLLMSINFLFYLISVYYLLVCYLYTSYSIYIIEILCICISDLYLFSTGSLLNKGTPWN